MRDLFSLCVYSKLKLYLFAIFLDNLLQCLHVNRCITKVILFVCVITGYNTYSFIVCYNILAIIIRQCLHNYNVNTDKRIIQNTASQAKRYIRIQQRSST